MHSAEHRAPSTEHRAPSTERRAQSAAHGADSYPAPCVCVRVCATSAMAELPRSIMGTAELDHALREGPLRYTSDDLLYMIDEPTTEPEAIAGALRDLVRWTPYARFLIFVRAAMRCARWHSARYGSGDEYDHASRRRNMVIFFGHLSGDALAAIIYTLLVKSMAVAQRDMVQAIGVSSPSDVGAPEASSWRSHIIGRWCAWVDNIPVQLMLQSHESSAALAGLKVDAVRQSLKRFLQNGRAEKTGVNFAWDRLSAAGMQWDAMTILDESSETQMQMNHFWDASVKHAIDAKRDEATHWQYSMNRLPDVLSHKVASYIDETLPPHVAVHEMQE